MCLSLLRIFLRESPQIHPGVNRVSSANRPWSIHFPRLRAHGVSQRRCSSLHVGSSWAQPPSQKYFRPGQVSWDCICVSGSQSSGLGCPRSRVRLVSSSADMVCTEPKQRGAPALMCLPRIQEKCIESLLIIKSYGFESKATSVAKLDQSLWKELCQNAFLRRNYVINYFYGMFQC